MLTSLRSRRAEKRRPEGPERAESVESFAEALDDLTLHIYHRHLTPQFALEARHPVLADAARCDPVEPAEVGPDVERESVGGDPTGRELHAYGGDLALLDPHPRVFRVVPPFER